MNKEDLLKQIADAAYNVGFGAKKHFATYDMVEKAPGIVAFLSMGLGIFGLVIDILSTKFLSATFLVLGIAVFYIERYNSNNGEYAKKGSVLTQLFNELKTLYFRVKSSNSDDLSSEEGELKRILDSYYGICIHKQILFSDWYAHYKFFWQHQIDWIDEQKHFKLWRDKIPLSLTVFISILLAGGVAAIVCACWGVI
ncbi:SLATT domain-containing protein [Syntrophotalea acetylenica]|uniref:SLATT domain-containing protein n=1 Tax=Syntrophotalea acetylenica TaxID=29542 RepID=UPI002A362C95|nr:SLATT domain-containing protein [Syntrophotalea acetylenica]MDY0261903.1 SLATT domain-containing protein [Syntrophotalea acetylenica]